MSLKTDYKNAIINTSANEKKKYTMTTNSDGTISLEDATVYTQVGDTFGATDINETNTEVNSKLDASKIVILNTDIGEGTSVEYEDGTIIFCKG